MSGLGVALNNALTGLNVNQQSLAVLSQNIANANTAGYSRQVLNQQSVYLDGHGAGVSLDDITRKIDIYLTRATQQQTSTVGAANVMHDYASRIQLLLGQPGSNNSIDSYINTFFSNLQSLAQTPQDTTLQRTVINSGVTLATQAHQLAQGLGVLQYQADQDIVTAITTINNDLRILSQVNTTIVNNLSLGKSVSDLQDQRDNLLKDISQYINISTFPRDNGATSITTGNGIPLLDNNIYQLQYEPVGSADAFANGTPVAALNVQRFDAFGNELGDPVELVSGGVPEDVVSKITDGSLAALLSMRDEDVPNILNQLDNLMASLRDEINALHNAGSAFPGANSYTGTREVNGGDFSLWSGSIRVAVLGSDGQAIDSPYSDETNGMPPLLLDLAALDTGQGAGNPSVQGIITAINQYFGAAQNKVELGNLNNIQLVSDTTALPNASAQFSFDFNLDNISATDANFFVTNLQVRDHLGVDITSVQTNVPSVALDPANTYITTAGSGVITVNAVGAHGFSNGDTIYLSTPGAPVDGIAEAALGGYFTISNVSTSSFDITVSGQASAGGTFGVAAQTAMAPYATAESGENIRTRDNGLITVDLSGNTSAIYYNITATVAVEDESGAIRTSQITYRVGNQQPNLLNIRHGALSANGSGAIVLPTNTQPIATAMLVDANGVELPRLNGQYTTEQSGYLKIVANNSTQSIAIDSLDSTQLGQPGNTPPVAASNRGFAFYFNLNDFFHSNELIDDGDTVANSALNLQVEQRLRGNASLISLGNLVRGSDSANPNVAPNFTYERNPSDNTIIQRLSTLRTGLITFSATGGLGNTIQTFSGYAAAIIGAASTNATTAKSNNSTSQALLEGYNERAASISGVNLDNELASTVIYQNAYAASARVITVANSMFDTLLGAFQS